MRLVEFPLEDGGSVLVEVDASPDGTGPAVRGWGERRVERAQQSFEQAIDRVQPAVRAILARLRAISDAPDEVQVEFGVQLSAEAGAFVASAGTTANFRVSMTWRSASEPTVDGGSPAGTADA